MLKGKLPTVALFGLTALGLGCAGPARVRPENVWDGKSPYLCRMAAGPITIDGKDHPDEWKHAMVIQDFFVPIDAPTTSVLLTDLGHFGDRLDRVHQ